MGSWRDLEAQFHQLEPLMEKSRLEHQWDETSDVWRIGGAADLEAVKRFRVLAAEAGTRIGSSGVVVPAAVAAEKDPANLWFSALWHMAGPHDEPIVGLMSLHGGAGGPVSTARIKQPARASATLALRFQASDHR
ncbi:MAG: hypothetical protein ACHQU1_04255 [Gemmatimonadales bacterium]